MRTFYLMALIALFTISTSFAGDIKESQVPSAVKNYVKANHPKATAVKWDFDKSDASYEAEFEVEGLEYELVLSPSGELLYGEMDVLLVDVPAMIQDYIAANYPGYDVNKAQIIKNGNSTKYEVSLSKTDSMGHKKYKNIYFDQNGNVIKKK